MTDAQPNVRERAIAGVRVAMIVNLVTLPMSFAINMLFGRVSPQALGYYGAIQLFVGGFYGFFVLGGPQVFARFVPSIDRRERIPFLLSYIGVCAALFLVVGGTALLAAPEWCSALLAKFGDPSIGAVLALTAAALVYAFCSHFLYGILEAPSAAVTLKVVTAGFFASALFAWGPGHAALERNPSGFLWLVSIAVYAAAAMIGVAQIVRKTPRPEFVLPRWFLPKGFWSVVFYVHLGTLVAFVYSSLAPSVVLFWMDVSSLAFLHAATRYPLLVTTLPAMMNDVIAPGLATLDASGQRGHALDQAAAAVNGAFLICVPLVLGFVLFASDAMALFGPEFVAHRGLLRVLALSALSAPLVQLGAGMLAAFGMFRSYLVASAIYVVAALALSAALIPVWGLPGAAWAAVLGTAIQYACVMWVLRRQVGFRTPPRAHAAWGCCAAAVAISSWMDPGRLGGAALFVAFLAAFWFLGGISWDEVNRTVRRMAGRG